MSFKENLEEMIDELEETKPFLTPDQLKLLDLYTKLLANEWRSGHCGAENSGSLTRINRVGLGDSVLSPKPSCRRTK